MVPSARSRKLDAIAAQMQYVVGPSVEQLLQRRKDMVLAAFEQERHRRCRIGLRVRRVHDGEPKGMQFLTAKDTQ